MVSLHVMFSPAEVYWWDCILPDLLLGINPIAMKTCYLACINCFQDNGLFLTVFFQIFLPITFPIYTLNDFIRVYFPNYKGSGKYSSHCQNTYYKHANKYDHCLHGHLCGNMCLFENTYRVRENLYTTKPFHLLLPIVAVSTC